MQFHQLITRSQPSASSPELFVTMPGVTAPVNAKLAQVPTVQIDQRGTFKYILCKIYEGNNVNDCKLIVRGTTDALFHADIYDYLDANLEADGISCECVGGGQIRHNPEEKSIEIFGKSQAYGRANHATTAVLLEESFTLYSIRWSDQCPANCYNVHKNNYVPQYLLLLTNNVCFYNLDL